MLRKLRKLVRSPGYFFRDFALKRTPGDSIGATLHGVDTSSFDQAALAMWLFEGIPALRVTDHLQLPVFGIAAYAVRHMLDRLAGLAGGYVAVDGGVPRPVSQLQTGAFRTAASSASTLTVYARVPETVLAVHITIWDLTGETLTARGNDLPVKRMAISRFGQGAAGFTAATRLAEDSPSAPIDVVFTWVNSDDPAWRNMLRAHRAEASIDWDRFIQGDELRFALRSVFMNAPWFNRIHILTNCAPPAWFKASPRVVWVDHRAVMPASALPAFNSNLIESYLWQIPGLAEQFIYFNDDFYLGRYLAPGRFFAGPGMSVSHMEPAALVDALAAETGAETETWQHAVVNAARAIERRFGVFPSRMHRHTPYCALRSVASAMEQEFADAFGQLRNNRFREDTDIAPMSFLYPHYAYLMKSSQRHTCQSVQVNQDNFGQVMRDVEAGRNQDFYCINDGGGSWKNAAFQSFKTELGDALFPLPSPCEAP